MIKQDILVSILVPIYKVEKFIERCAISLFEQTYQNIEYIFVDDCSPDDSISILKKVLNRFPNRKKEIKIISHSKNRGLAAARKTALNNAKGEYILNVDSDDFLDVKTIEILINKVYSSFPDIVVFNYKILYSDNNIVPINRMMNFNKEKMLEDILSFYTSPCIWGELIKRNLYIENHIYPIEGLDYGEDYVVTTRLFYKAKKVEYVKEYLYYYNKQNMNSYMMNITTKQIDMWIETNIFVNNYFTSQKQYEAYRFFLALGTIHILGKSMEIGIDKHKIDKLRVSFMKVSSFKTNLLWGLKKSRMNILFKLYKRILRQFN